MPQPFDYTTGQNGPSIADNFLSGVQSGQTLRNNQDQLQFAEKQRQLALQRQQQQQKDIVGYFNLPAPSARDTAKLVLTYPELAKPAQEAFGAMSTEQQTAKLGEATSIYGALTSGRPDLAKQNLDGQILAAKNAKRPAQEVAQLQMLSDMIDKDPQSATRFAGLHLASILGPEKFTAAYGGTQAAEKQAATLPSDVRKGAAEATSAEAKAGIDTATAPAMIEKPVLENQMIGENITTAQQKRDLDAFDSQIKAANSETQRGELQLKRDEYVQKMQQQNQNQGLDTQNLLDGINSSLDLVGRIKAHPALAGYTGSDPTKRFAGGVGSTLGKALAILPGTADKDFRSMVETLKSQQFLNQAKELKGMGALSDAEGARIERAIASLDVDQSPQAFTTALGVIESTLNRGREKALASGKTPTGGGAFVFKSPKFGNVTEGQINQVMKQNPGSTRAQVIEFLQSK